MMVEKISRILIDMDEVLVDFVGAAAARWGTSKHELERFWTPGDWSILAALNRQRCVRGFSPATVEDFWAAINGSEEFWIDLPKLPWFDEVMDLVQSRYSDWYIVTAPTWCNSSYTGKVLWLKREFGDSFSRYVITPHKHLMANPRTLLIDDSDGNVDRFAEAGGDTILFPRLNNSLFRYRQYPMDYLRVALNSR